jgi:hypothetical protein
VKKIVSTEIVKPLGRWKIEDCNKMTNYKIDSANEDHCGVCSQYRPLVIQCRENTNIDMTNKENIRYRMSMDYPHSYW